MKDITVTLTEDEWATVVSTLQRGYDGYTTDKNALEKIMMSASLSRQARKGLKAEWDAIGDKMHNARNVREKIADKVLAW